MSGSVELVTITIDGQTVQVPKGTNLIEAAKKIGLEIPHYCYHPNLSIAGNCRMCQVQIEGMPKLQIGCNTGATEGMVVKTQNTSEDAENAQRATLEFLLINQPLDCTVCDQAGHCKLQDYYYEYNSKGSRFIEDKVNKVKAEPLGPNVIYDGERCIVCTRCVRFCEEVPKTSELGVFNRGDKSVIGISNDKELDNPFAGTVVDLCPVGALTHRKWRFNTRIWYTSEADTICTGCSTGCNVKVAVRDGKVVHVKARLNQEVNKEWLCDEGRYGFESFQPAARLEEPKAVNGNISSALSWDQAKDIAKKLQGNSDSDAAVILSPLLTLEEIWVATKFASQVMGIANSSSAITGQLKLRNLSDLEKILISPDRAANARSFAILNIGSSDANWREFLQHKYFEVLEKIRSGSVKRILFVGDEALLPEDIDDRLQAGIASADCVVWLRAADFVAEKERLSNVLLLPARTVNEKSGVMVNTNRRLQRLRATLSQPFGGYPEWLALNEIANACNKSILENVSNDREVFRAMTKEVKLFAGLSYAIIGEQGISLDALPVASHAAKDAAGENDGVQGAHI